MKRLITITLSKAKEIKCQLFNFAYTFGYLDILYGIFVWRFIARYGDDLHRSGVSATENTTIVLSLVSVGCIYYIVIKVGILLCSLLPINIIYRKEDCYYCYAVDKQENLEQRTSERKGAIPLLYTAIRKIVIMPEGHEGYFSYRVRLFRNTDKITIPITRWFYEDAFEGVTVDDWLAAVKKHNPKVKIKRYKSRWWMF